MLRSGLTDFKWTLFKRYRDNQYKKLCEYKEKHGNCHVPRPYPQDPKVRLLAKTHCYEIVYADYEASLRSKTNQQRKNLFDTAIQGYCIQALKLLLFTLHCYPREETKQGGGDPPQAIILFWGYASLQEYAYPRSAL